jgi:hypothetical protein
VAGPNIPKPTTNRKVKEEFAMKNLMMAALIGLVAACGGGGSAKPKADARPITVDPIDAPAGGAVCNVLANTGCATGEKCTWVIDSFTGRDAVGRVACAPAGAKKLGEMCQTGNGMTMATGSDDCEGGLYCNGRVCKTVCDLAGGDPMCGPNGACSRYVNTFGNKGDPALAGVCDPTCDPITQKLDGVTGPAADNCGAPLDDMGKQTKGCYGFWDGARSRFSCSSVINPDWGQDTITPTGEIFINSCAPGFAAGYRKGSGSMDAICSAICIPGDVYQGGTDPTGGAAPTGCGTRAKGPDQVDDVVFDCVHGWYLEVGMDGMLQPETKYSKLGLCRAWSRFNDTATPPKPITQCSDKPKSEITAMDEAWNFGCRPREVVPPHTSLIGPTRVNNVYAHEFNLAYPMALQ